MNETAKMTVSWESFEDAALARLGGLEGAVQEQPRPRRPGKLDDKGEAHHIALACSPAPEGHDH